MTRTINTLTVLTALAMAPATAWAGDFGFNLDIGGREGHVGVGVHVGDRVGVGVHVGSSQPVAVRRYAPVEYAVVTERVWVPTTETVIREVPVYDACGRIVAYRQEPQVIQGGYWTTVQKPVPIRHGPIRRPIIGDPHRRYPAVNVGVRTGDLGRVW